jgi:hypothetical protein
VLPDALRQPGPAVQTSADLHPVPQPALGGRARG